ncbi:type-1 angiotensin II receptor-associated protein [Biomphalaria glabrata]|nr:type-1 angiotensin II receptor-associated protein [Biomphalaria glabrata]
MNVNFCFIQFLVTLLFSVLNDILCLSLYEPRGYNTFQPIGGSLRNEYRFALGMAITNLLLKPVTAFFLVRIYKSRSLGTDFNSGIPGFVGVGGSNVDSKQETVGPYAGPPEHYPYQEPPTYQQTPGTDAP